MVFQVGLLRLRKGRLPSRAKVPRRPMAMAPRRLMAMVPRLPMDRAPCRPMARTSPTGVPPTRVPTLPTAMEGL